MMGPINVVREVWCMLLWKMEKDSYEFCLNNKLCSLKRSFYLTFESLQCCKTVLQFSQKDGLSDYAAIHKTQGRMEFKKYSIISGKLRRTQ